MSYLAVEVLGSGGAVRTPRPGCQCALCREARTHGIPWARTGPSLLVHGPNVLIDTPEDACLQLDRAQGQQIAAAFYSHWHPDHTRGNRVWETRNGDFLRWPPKQRATPIYLPPRVREDFERFGILESLRYMQNMGYVRVRDFDAPLELGGWRISHFPVAEPYVFAFLFEELGLEAGQAPRRVLICMDELYGWTPPDALRGVDLAVLPKGLFEFDPELGDRWIPADHPVLGSEATWQQTLDMVRALQPRQVIFTHIEEPDRLNPRQYEALAHRVFHEEGIPVTFAWDTLMVELEQREGR